MTFGVVERMPIINLANVPEFPKLRFIFFFAEREPKPFPYTEYIFFLLEIFTPSFFRHLMQECTSCDSNIFFPKEIF